MRYSVNGVKAEEGPKAAQELGHESSWKDVTAAPEIFYAFLAPW